MARARSAQDARLDGALPEVLLEEDWHRVVDIAVGRHEMGQGGVAVTVHGLGGGHVQVEGERRVAALRSEELEQGLRRVARTGVQPVGDDKGARVDERIARDAVLVLQLDQRVERVAGRLPAHVLPQCVALTRQIEGEREDLGDGLGGERLPPLPHAVHGSVRFTHRHAEAARVEGGERGDVVRGAAAPGRPLDLFGDAFQYVLERRRRRHGLHRAASRAGSLACSAPGSGAGREAAHRPHAPCPVHGRPAARGRPEIS